VKWVDGPGGKQVPIVISPPIQTISTTIVGPGGTSSLPASAGASAAAAVAAAVAGGRAPGAGAGAGAGVGAAGTGPVTVSAAALGVPGAVATPIVGAGGQVPAGGIAAGAAAAGASFDLKNAVGEVLKVITNHLDDSDMRSSLNKQKDQENSIRQVTKQLSSLEQTTRDLISTTAKQTQTLKGMLGFSEFKPAAKPLLVETAAEPKPADN